MFSPKYLKGYYDSPFEESEPRSPPGVTMRSTVNGEGAATFSKTPAEQCLDDIYTLQNEIEGSGYGTNRESVQKAISDQKLRAEKVDKLSRKVKDASRENQSTTEEREKLQSAYDKLKDISQKKTNCLETMVQIATMQQLCVNLSRQFDSKAVNMVDLGEKDLSKIGENLQGFIAASSQDCIFATRDNWDWIVKLVKCIDVHLKNASGYQQFFHEIEESSVWLHEDLKRIHDSFSVTPMHGEYNDGQRLLQEIKDVLVSLRQWETKTNFLWEKGIKIVPVHVRTNGVKEPTPARAIVDYKTSEFSVRDEEDLLLLDNSDSQLWKVRNARGDEGYVPALAVLIPGPFKEAVEAAIQMRLKLLAAWTNALKVIGRRLIVFMLMVFKPDYNEDEITTMKSIQMMDRQDLMRILDYVENTLKSHWAEHEGFQNLQERILMLRMILEDAEVNPITDENLYKALVIQITTLEQLMKKYQDLWKEWEKNKCALESSQAPELMLICDKWEQLKFVSRDQFAKFWQHELPFTEDEKSLLRLQELKISGAIEGLEEGIMYDNLDDTDFETADGLEMISEEGLDETVVKTTTLNTATARSVNGTSGGIMGAALMEELESIEEGMFAEEVIDSAFGFEEHRARGLSSEGSDFGYATETKTAQTEQLSQAEVEESKRFVIRSVVDASTDEEISLDDAIAAGIIKPDEGIYKNLKTDETVPIAEAMMGGLIKVVFTTTKRSKEKKSTIGIIAVKTERMPIRPYVVKTVKDTNTNEDIKPEEGIKRGILNENMSVFRDLKTRQEYLLADASQKDLAAIEFTGPEPKNEVISRTYAVRAVVDRRRRKIISFHDAVSRGIINKESGAYRDTLSGKDMYVGDAIMRGFLKARLIDSATSKSMDIDPRNKVVIDATKKIRKKLVTPLAVINAMKRASKSSDS